MPKKNKTNKSVAKRMKATGGGGLKHATPGRRHLNAHMSGKKMRQLRQPGMVPAGLVKKYLLAIGEY